MSEWKLIESAPQLTAVYISYVNSHGKRRGVKAEFIPRFTIHSNGESESFDEYCEEKDEYFLCEGWYELIDNWGNFSSIYVNEGVPDFWHPLPELPEELV